jgi:hypothetical protein
MKFSLPHRTCPPRPLLPLTHEEPHLHQDARERVADQAEPCHPSAGAVSPSSRSRCVTRQAESSTSAGGPPGIRTPNLRIKSPVRMCSSEGCTASELRVCVSALLVSSRCFPFLRGDETGTRPRPALPFRLHAPINDGPTWGEVGCETRFQPAGVRPPSEVHGNRS